MSFNWHMRDSFSQQSFWISSWSSGLTRGCVGKRNVWLKWISLWMDSRVVGAEKGVNPYTNSNAMIPRLHL
jgi:hypothetical protein